MTADELHKMQQDAKKRHGFVEKEKSMTEILNENFDFIDGELILKQRYKKRQEKILMPDLMVTETSLPCTSVEKKEEVPVIKKEKIMESIFDKPYVPKPVQDKKKRIYTHFTALAPDPPKKEKEQRPPAKYDNVKSPYGIYDELKESWGR